MSEETSPASSIDFASIMSAASAEMDAHPMYPSAEASAPAAAPVVTTSPDPARVKGSADVVAKPAEVVADVVETDDDPEEVPADSLNLDEYGNKLVKVKVDGKETLVPLSEALGGYSRTQKFTKEMQALRTREEAIQANETSINKLVDERNSLVQLMSNKERLNAYMQQAFGQAVAEAAQAAGIDPAAFGDPDEIVTVGQARQLAEQLVTQKLGQFQQQITDLNAGIEKKLETNTQALKDRQEVAKYSETITTALAEIFEAHPVLKGDSFAEDILRFEVGKMKPKSVEEAVEAFRTVAQGRAESLSAHFTNINKVKVARKAKLDKAIEPAGGTGPQLQPTSYKTADGKVDWKSLKDAAAQMMK